MVSNRPPYRKLKMVLGFFKSLYKFENIFTDFTEKKEVI